MARKAGVNVGRILLGVYVISGACAAVGGLAMLAQLGAVSPTFGKDREFDAIAAAVLGGTSLFGGRGNVFPGAVVGSVTVAMVFNGLNALNANPYVYPVITGGVIFLAVLLDGLRRRQLRAARPRLLLTAGGAA
jgi:ribose transport system permease protein